MSWVPGGHRSHAPSRRVPEPQLARPRCSIAVTFSALPVGCTTPRQPAAGVVLEGDERRAGERALRAQMTPARVEDVERAPVLRRAGDVRGGEAGQGGADAADAPRTVVHLVVVTRNARDFTNAGLKVVDPFT